MLFSSLTSHRPTRRLVSRAALALLIAPTLLAGWACPAHAQTPIYSVVKEADYIQTGNAQPTVATTYWFSASMGSNLPNNLGGATSTTLTYAGPGSPLSLPAFGGPPPNGFQYTEPFADKASLDSAFPSGISYTFTLNGGTLNGQTGVINMPTDAYPATPFLTGNTFTQLQGMDPTQPFTLTINGFTPSTGGNFATSLLQISSGGFVYNDSGTTSTTAFTLAANTLQPNTTYSLGLFYQDNVTSSQGFGGSGFGGGVFEAHTFANFTTGPGATAAAPEPGVLAFLVGGLLPALALRRRRLQ